MSIKLQNTLSGKKETFIPITPGKVKIYTCGPTVYDFAHIGNFRSFLMSDLLTRVMKYAGFEVTKVQNITDVGHLVSDGIEDSGEDKILKKARLEKKDPFAIARSFEAAFVEDAEKLRMLPPDHLPRATEFIPEQIELTQKLIDEGFAYEVNGSVYFRTKKFKKYGQLSKNKLEDLIAGARVEINDEKEDPLDFALWKAAPENHIMKWESPWGIGFPGWHLECSAMSRKLLGDQFDIHTGGEDNIFPHHECEIAQNEGSNGGKKSVNYWLHAKYLLVDGKKMAKSDGNFFTVRALFKEGFTGEEIRYLLLSSHYRTALNFTFDGLEMARQSIRRIVEAGRIFGEIAEDTPPDDFITPYRNQFKEALFDDLNVSEALAAIFDMIKAGMKLREENKLTPEQAAGICEMIEQDFTQIFDVLPGKSTLDPKRVQEIEALITKRQKAREDKDWALSDEIRDQLAANGIELVDGAGGTSFRVK